MRDIKDDIAILLKHRLNNDPVPTVAYEAVMAWLADSKFQFVLGTPWTLKHEGDPPELDYSMWDDHVVPIYLEVDDEEKFAFVQDIKLTAGGNSDYTAALKQAQLYADLLNNANRDMPWRRANLPYLLLNDAAFAGGHC
jgi:hypothetical protein